PVGGRVACPPERPKTRIIRVFAADFCRLAAPAPSGKVRSRKPLGALRVQAAGTNTLLFTDIEGSTRLWEQEGERMSRALAEHDALSRRAVEENRGVVVKMTGDGMYAAFADPVDALNATAQLQEALAQRAADDRVELRIRAGLHLGIVERRDD